MPDPSLSPTPGIEPMLDDVLGRWMFARHGRISSHVGADSFVQMLAEAGFEVVPLASSSVPPVGLSEEDLKRAAVWGETARRDAMYWGADDESLLAKLARLASPPEAEQ